MKAGPTFDERGTEQARATTMQFPERPGWLQDVNSMLVSATVHLTLLIVLGLLTVASSGSMHGDKLIMSLGGGDEGGSSDAPIADGSAISAAGVTDVATESLAASVGPTSEVDISTPLTTEFAAPDVLSVSPTELAGGAGTALEPSLGGSGESLGGSAGSGKGRGGGKGDGSATKASTEFFGIGGYGQTFVYVVDCSDSMNDRGKFERARYELLKSIEQLSSEQRYYVIFYNSGAFPMDAEKPQLASKENIAKTMEWINLVEPTGGTNPLPALMMALDFQPDAIYFLSDGQFDPGTIQVLRNRNHQNLRLHIKQVPIHTIAFLDRFAEGLMRMIARNSGGEYKFVN
jgi:hypothetical protein